MSVRKPKRKAKSKHLKHATQRASLLSKYPRIAFYVGILLLLTGICLLIFGIHNSAKVGLAMIALFAGGATLFFANGSLPKKTSNQVKK